ncbi:MAG: hypothetical protein JXA77_16570 [Bacteroidales bacterium]|nr:hypothetical protein [Bacteroidales bacterium]MBN2819314.1 hypothetical protein [Bacteroidales bacterium]
MAGFNRNNQVYSNYPTPSYITKGKFLIITPSDFESAIGSFANYKRNIGYDVTVVNTNVTGKTATAIKAYLQTQYDNTSTRPEFVLLIGDHNYIPASGGVTPPDMSDPLTDLHYAKLDGNNNLPDVFLGRFSVTTIPQLNNIINKTIEMEYTFTTIERQCALLSGSGEGAKVFDNPQRWVAENVFEPLNFDCNKLFAFDGATYNDGLDALDDDNQFFIYRGHGNVGYTGSPFGISQSEINAASNNAYPLFFSFACLTNHFAQTSLGEYWTRSEKGGIAFFGATTTTYRHTNNVIEKRVFKQLDEMDQLSPFINLGMIDYYKRVWSLLSGSRKVHIKTYILLGDPSFYVFGIGCQDNYIFSNNELFLDGQEIDYHASNSIITDYGGATFVLESGSDVNLYAGNTIILNSGFSVELGSTFTANIEPCSK